MSADFTVLRPNFVIVKETVKRSLFPMIATPPTALPLSAASSALVQGEVITQVEPYAPGGGAVMATILIPQGRSQVWEQLTSYHRWVEFFPDITRSEVIAARSPHCKQLLQAACKTFLMFSIAVEIQLQVDEIPLESIRFSMVDGGASFRDFAAVLELSSLPQGTQLSYRVQATPTLPVPSMFIEQAMKLDLPLNMRHLRKVLLQQG